MDIKQPIIHDRHIVKQQFEVLKSEVAQNTYKCPDNLTIVTCRNEGSMSERIIPHLAGYENVSILDIFPTILFIFDLSIPNDINGRILQQAFNDEFFEGKLSKNINSYEDNISKTLLNMNFLLFDDEIIKRLESIGYLV